MKYFILLTLLVSCSHTRHNSGIIHEIDKENISSQTVLDLARSSYLRGCVDGKNEFAAFQNNSAFKRCLEMAKVHEADIKTIIDAQIKQDPTR